MKKGDLVEYSRDGMIACRRNKPNRRGRVERVYRTGDRVAVKWDDCVAVQSYHVDFIKVIEPLIERYVHLERIHDSCFRLSVIGDSQQIDFVLKLLRGQNFVLCQTVAEHGHPIRKTQLVDECT